MIELEQIAMTYGAHRALDALDLQVPAGSVLGLLGPNGAGKSTTISIVAGLLRPSSGRVAVGGVDVVAEPERARANVAYVSESVALYPYLSGLENLRLFARMAGARLDARAAGECLERAGLAGDAHRRRVSGYSKGMRQKVGLAIALAKGAKALLLDEPSSGLDPSASHELSLRIRELASEGVAVLMATHDLFRARDTCDAIALLVGGRVMRQWEGSEVRAADLETAYIEVVSESGASKALVEQR